MIRIKRARVLGYCMGVRKAVDAVLSTLTGYSGKAVSTYGPLIHNPATLCYLKEKGVRVIDPDRELQPQIIPETPVIIRAHGIAPQKRQELEAYNAVIIDATCPRVIANQRRAARYAEKGYTVILAGDRKHGECIGIVGYVQAVPGSRCFVVQTAEDAAALDLCAASKAVLLAQTTIKRTEYRAVTDILLKKNPELVVLDTICPATDERQEALLELIDEVDALLVIGGKTSANTRRLVQTALDRGTPAWLAETADDIPEALYRYETIGLAAGASTPDSSIDTVEAALTSRCSS